MEKLNKTKVESIKSIFLTEFSPWKALADT